MASQFQFLPNVLDDGLSIELMNAGRLCFNCEQIFASRKCLEEHHCPAPSFICTCGSEFMSYQEMMQHNRTHELGSQVLSHETIKKRRIEKHWEEEEKLKRLQSGEVIWESPKPSSVKVSPQMPSSSKMPSLSKEPTSSKMPASSKMPPVKVLPPVPPRASPDVRQNVSTSDTSKVFSNIGAPTVDLWTLFQPIVVVKSMRSSSKRHVYTCCKCGQTFATKRSLVIHHNTHVADKVSGCIGCGLLLSSRKFVPRFHSCNATQVYKFKLITARPLKQITINIANSLAKMNRSSPLKTQNNGSFSKSSGMLDNYKVSAAKKPFAPVQIKSVVSNAKQPSVTTPPAAQITPGPVSQTPGKGYECRVCHVFFESINVLQRHKCAKAHEFLLKHKLATPVNRQRQVVSSKVPSSSLQNSDNTTVVSAPTGNTNIQNNVSNANNKESTAVVSDDDCFIVESGPEKPAEVIYQVTSSLPIKT